jgi:hypothetical protein
LMISAPYCSKASSGGKAFRGELVPVHNVNGLIGLVSYLEVGRQYTKVNWSTSSFYPGYGITFIFAINLMALTEEELHKGYSNKATKGGRGRFYKFAKSACEALGIDVPSDRTIERCLENEGLRGWVYGKQT